MNKIRTQHCFEKIKHYFDIVILTLEIALAIDCHFNFKTVYQYITGCYRSYLATYQKIMRVCRAVISSYIERPLVAKLNEAQF